jgi:hypothetical protein
VFDYLLSVIQQWWAVTTGVVAECLWLWAFVKSEPEKRPSGAWAVAILFVALSAAQFQVGLGLHAEANKLKASMNRYACVTDTRPRYGGKRAVVIEVGNQSSNGNGMFLVIEASGSDLRIRDQWCQPPLQPDRSNIGCNEFQIERREIGRTEFKFIVREKYISPNSRLSRYFHIESQTNRVDIKRVIYTDFWIADDEPAILEQLGNLANYCPRPDW